MKWTDFEKTEVKVEEAGFRVMWDTWTPDGFKSDFTPEMDEDPFPMVHKAWTRADRIKNAIPEAMNIHVVSGDSLTPVDIRRLRPYVPEAEPVEE